MLALIIGTLTKLDECIACHKDNEKFVKLMQQAQAMLMRDGADKLDLPPDQPTYEEIALLKTGDYVQAIKSYRARTGAGLYNGKMFIQEYALKTGLAYEHRTGYGGYNTVIRWTGKKYED